jgi:antitoxin MazE
MMRVAVRKWGNSLAVRIPRAFAEDVRLTEGSEVDVKVERGRLVLVPLDPTATLADLLAAVTDANRHGEIEFGPAVGREVW